MSFVFLLMPLNIHDADKPLPVPSSKILPEGLDATSVFNKLPVYKSEAMLNSSFLLAFAIFLYCLGMSGKI
jgi:hypothetical protein